MTMWHLLTSGFLWRGWVNFLWIQWCTKYSWPSSFAFSFYLQFHFFEVNILLFFYRSYSSFKTSVPPHRVLPWWFWAQGNFHCCSGNNNDQKKKPGLEGQTRQQQQKKHVGSAAINEGNLSAIEKGWYLTAR